MPSLPVLNEDYARYLHRYPPLLKHVSQLIAGIQSRMKKITRKVGEAAIRQTLTQVVSALQRRYPSFLCKRSWTPWTLLLRLLQGCPIRLTGSWRASPGRVDRVA